MGELFRLNKLRILIWSNDHEPIHVHVIMRAEDIEFRVLVATLEVQHVSKNQLSSRDEKRVLKFIENHKEEIMEAWHEIQKDQQK
jgi:hypothetical protein